MPAFVHLALLPSRALVRVAGGEARGFLQGLLTQDTATLAPGELRYAALLSPQGRLLHDLFLLGEADGVLVDVAAAEREALASRLTLYRLRAKVTVEAVEGAVYALWPDGGDGLGAPDPRLPALGRRLYGATVEPTASEDGYDAHRLALGVPDPARDAAGEKTYPLEANLDLLGAIDFRKGCFVGQETTSRMKRRAAVKSRMVPLDFDGPVPAFGSEVLAGELRAGEMLSGRPAAGGGGRALALLRLDRAAAGGLTAEGRPVRLDPPDWLAEAISGVALAAVEG